MAEKQNPDDFWREFEETTGEKVLARGLGRYAAGWPEFDGLGRRPLWGLVIASTGGFRFHHFPQTGGLLGALGSGGVVPKEKTIFVPGDRITSAVIVSETKWYKKLFSPDSPFLVIGYAEEAGAERELRFASVHRSDGGEGDIAGVLAKSGFGC